LPGEGWNSAAWKSFLVPGAALVLAAVAVLQGGWPAFSSPAIDSYYYVGFGAGLLLAWRFNSGRVLFSLFTLLLSHRALVFFAAGSNPASGPGRVAFELIGILLPLNFIALSEMRERGLTIPAVAPRTALLFVESVFVAILCRPEQVQAPSLVHLALLPRSWFAWTSIPQPALLAFLLAFGLLFFRYALYRKPAESGMLWSLVAAGLSLQSGSGIGTVSSAYVATAGLIIASSVIENFYVLAYHDELTSLPSRRAFNDALLRLEAPYAIAAVDIDHFKSFNDTYGHEVGDQVLRMVAGKLARVSGGGRAFRVGGEEFSILFPGKTAQAISSDLELLRAVIERSAFSLRTPEERRRVSRGSDRRTSPRSKSKRAQPTEARAVDIFVTVSIGVAEAKAAKPGMKHTFESSVQRVVRAADKALYRAKESGRNRVEIAGQSNPPAARPSKRSIA